MVGQRDLNIPIMILIQKRALCGLYSENQIYISQSHNLHITESGLFIIEYRITREYLGGWKKLSQIETAAGH